MNTGNPFVDLPAFVRVVELKSFTRAADALGTTQSAVSQAVSRLERRLGVTLLRRTTRSLSLTAEGERYFQRCRNLLLELVDAQNELTEQQAEPHGRIRFSAPGAYGRIVLAPVLGRFAHRHPGVELEVDLSDRTVDLVEEGYDLTVRIGDLADSSLVARRLGSVQMGYFASPAFLRGAGTPRRPQDLVVETTLAHMRPGGDLFPLRFRSPDGKPLQRALRTTRRFNDIEAMCEAVTQGLGVGSMHTFVAQKALARKRLVPVLQSWWPEPTPVWCLRPPGRLVPQRTRLLMAELEKECAGLLCAKPAQRSASSAKSPP